MKSIEEIYEELAGEFQRRTGLTAAGSSDLSVRFYAVAAQLYGLGCQLEWMGKQCFPQTATSSMLDYHGQMRNIQRHSAERAVGAVRFFAAEDRVEATVIPEGTVCMTAEGTRFVTMEAAEIGLDESQVDVNTQAVETGEGGNAAAGRITFLSVAPTGVTACTNPAPMTGGRDEEDDEALRARILATYARLANGANAAFYEQTAMGVPGVAAVKVLPRNRGIGTVDVVVSAMEGMPSGELLEKLEKEFNALREIAVDVKVNEPTRTDVNLEIRLSVEQGYPFEKVKAQVESGIRGWFNGSLLGKPVLQAELTSMVFLAEGVANCAVTISGGDVAAVPTALPCVGTLTITEA